LQQNAKYVSQTCFANTDAIHNATFNYQNGMHPKQQNHSRPLPPPQKTDVKNEIPPHKDKHLIIHTFYLFICVTGTPPSPTKYTNKQRQSGPQKLGTLNFCLFNAEDKPMRPRESTRFVTTTRTGNLGCNTSGYVGK